MRSAWFFIMLVLACDDGASSSVRTQPRDSAGIAIVEHSTLDVPAWTLDAAAALEMTGADLFRVAGAHRRADGRVVVANGGSSELLFFDDAGALTHRTGAIGAGPREFLGISALFAFGEDSLLVFDQRLDRFSVYDAEGNHARTFQFDRSVDPIVMPAGLLQNGELLGLKTTHMVALTRAGINVDSALLLRFDRDGALIDSVARLEHNHRFRRMDGRRHTTVGVPFAPEGRIAVQGGAYCYGTGATYEIRCFAADGQLVRIIRIPHSAEAVTGEMIEAHFSPPGDDAARLRNARQRLRAEMPIPAQLPHFDVIEFDDDGNLWVRDFVAEGTDRTDVPWTIFDAGGVAVAAITTPNSFRPLHIGQDFVVGLWLDEFDVERVGLFPLTRS